MAGLHPTMLMWDEALGKAVPMPNYMPFAAAAPSANLQQSLPSTNLGPHPTMVMWDEALGKAVPMPNYMPFAAAAPSANLQQSLPSTNLGPHPTMLMWDEALGKAVPMPNYMPFAAAAPSANLQQSLPSTSLGPHPTMLMWDEALGKAVPMPNYMPFAAAAPSANLQQSLPSISTSGMARAPVNPPRRRRREPEYYKWLTAHYGKGRSNAAPPPAAPVLAASTVQQDPSSPDSPPSAGLDHDEAHPAMVGQPPSSSRPTRPRSKRRRTAKMHEAWAAAMPELLEAYLFRYGVLEAARLPSALQSSRAEEVLQLRLHQIAPRLPCPGCGLCSMEAQHSASSISYCSLSGWVDVMRPTCICRSCNQSHSISPVLLGCFPATPVEHCTWFDEGVLEAARAIRRHGSYSMLGVSRVIQDLQAFHSGGRPGEDKYRDVRTLNQALIGYSLLQIQLDRCSFAPPVPDSDAGTQEPAGMCGCPACSVTCVAVCGDACYAMRRFQKVAKESKGLRPLALNSPFIPDSQIAEKLQSRQPSRILISNTPACSEFKADDAQGRKVSHYDKTGVAAFLCRHGFVLRACSMTTSENFIYYEELLEDVVEFYFNKPGCQLKFVFVDVACRMEAMLSRVVSAARVPRDSGVKDLQLLVGPWHIYAHQASCQLLYNARLMAGTGLTFGDLPEHLWASLRKHSGPLAYMGDAAREDVMCILMLEREHKKVLELPFHLDKVHARTHAQALLMLRDELGGLLPNPDLPSPCELARQARAHPGHQPAGQQVTASRRKLTEFKLVSALEKQHLHRNTAPSDVTPFTSPTSRVSVPRMGPQRLQLTRELQQLESQIQKLRSELAMPNLQYASQEYWQICAEAKAYNISRLHQEIEATLSKYNSLVLHSNRGTDTVGRHESRRLRTQRSKAGSKLMLLMDQLIEQHSFHGQVAHTYSPLEVKVQLQSWLSGPGPGASLQLPWGCPGTHLDKAQHDQQAYLRCVEELQILEREARDTISYHERHIKVVDAQLQLTDNSICQLQQSSLDAPLEAVRVLASIRASYGSTDQLVLTPGRGAARQRAITVLLGCKQLLASRRTWLAKRVDDAKQALTRMQLRSRLPVGSAGSTMSARPVSDIPIQADDSDVESLDSEGLPRNAMAEPGGQSGSEWEEGSDELHHLVHSSSEGHDDM